MWERIKQYGRVLSAAGNAADWVWRALVLFFGLTAAGVIAWSSTTWEWYWNTFQWAGVGIVFLTAYLLLATSTLIFAAASSYLRRGANPIESSRDDGPLIWFSNLTLEGGQGRPVFSLRFHGTNASQREVELRAADIASAINGTRLHLEVLAVTNAGENSFVPINRIQLIPPGAPIELVAKFNLPAGMEPDVFLETWRQFFFNAKDDSRTYRQNFNEGALMVFFPGRVGPRVTAKPQARAA